MNKKRTIILKGRKVNEFPDNKNCFVCNSMKNGMSFYELAERNTVEGLIN